MAEFTDRLRRLPNDTAASLSFFSRLPVEAPAGPFNLSRSAGGWPLAGIILAVVPALDVVINAWLGIPPLVSAFLVVAIGVALTGALHEDGLADTFDGIVGGRNPPERLYIMRDSRLGVFGVLALILSVAVRAAALSALIVVPADAVLALIGVAAVSRALALWHWSTTEPARTDGMAFDGRRPDTEALQIGLLTGLIAWLVLLVVFGFAALLGLVVAMLAIAFHSSFVNRRIRGHTGDTIGAAQQITETLLLACLSAAATATVIA
jgi:adenosylcobinamide-GDP ribazoletransferase